MKRIFYKNLILFLVGFCVYTTIEVLFRGYSYPASGLMGGISIVLIDKINDKISWNIDLSLQAIIGAAIVTLIELIIGTIAKYSGLLPIMWNYSNMPLNYDGIICVPFSVAWIFLSLIAIFLADAINYYVLGDEERPHYILFGRFIFLFKSK